VPGEPRLGPVHVLQLEQRHPVDEATDARAARPRADLVEQQRAEHRPDRRRDDHERQVHAPARGEVAGEREHDLAGDRREHVLGEDEDADPDLAERVHHVGGHTRETGQLRHRTMVPQPAAVSRRAPSPSG
jgi:hypothetical protein